MPFLSFPWVLREILGEVAVEARPPGTSKTSFQVPDADYEEHRDAQSLPGRRQRIRSNLQGDIYADPYQPVTISAENKAEDPIAKPTEAHVSRQEPERCVDTLRPRLAPSSPTVEQMRFSPNAPPSTNPLISGARSSSAAAGKVTSPLDEDEDEGIGAHPETLNEMDLVSPHIVLDQQQDRSENKPDMQRTDSKSHSAELEGLNMSQISHADADVIYRSKVRHSNAQSGSSSSQQGNLQSSGRSSAAATPSPRTEGPSSSTFTLQSLPERAATLADWGDGRIQRTTPEPGFTILSAKAPFRKEIDSDDEGEIMIYGDPAGMAM
jgi:hypothetical protein